MMDAPRTGAFLLVQLLVPVSCGEVVFTEPFTCFLLDGVLLIFSIIATALYIREKFCSIQPVAAEVPELDRWTDAEPYQVLEPSKRKKKAGKKKKTQSTQAEEGDHHESLSPGASASPSSPC